MPLFNIEGVEIFEVGTWNDDKFTKSDLDEMVKAFNANKNLLPVLKLGHNDSQKMLQEDGLPAAGWVGNLYRKGKKLIADFKDLPEKVFKLIENGAYKKVSSEIFFDIEINGQKFKRMLSAVALLGQDMPAVSTLADIMALYSKNNNDSELKVFCKDEPKIYNFKKEEYSMPENDELKKQLADALKANKDMAAKLAKLEKSNGDKDSKFTKLESRLEVYEKQVKDAEKKAFENEKKAELAELDTYLTGIDNVTPAMKEFAKELLGENKKEYSISTIKDKKFTKRELFSEVLKLYKESLAVNLVENSVDNKKTEDNNTKIEAYAKEHNCSYKQAYDRVMAK